MQNVIAIAVTAVVLVPGTWWVLHTRLVADRAAVDESWEDVDHELRCLVGLLPQLIEAINDAGADESDLTVELAAHHDRAVATAAHTAAAAAGWFPPLLDAARRAVALIERRLEAVDGEQVVELRGRLTTIETRIATARHLHDAQVERCNRRVASFPSSVVAGRHGFTRAETFDA